MASEIPKTKAVVVAQRITYFLFLPKEVDYNSAFGKPLSALVLTCIAMLAVLAFPPLMDLIISSFPNYWPMSRLASNWEYWGRWLPFYTFSLELILALLLSGSVFGQWLASKSEEVLQNAQDRFEAATAHNVERAGQDLVNLVAKCEASIASANFLNLPSVLWSVYRDSKEILTMLFQTVPKVNSRFLAAKLAVAFPGGLYGLLAFLVFWLVAFCNLLELYHGALNPNIL